MPYADLMTMPMRQELTRLGVEELTTPQQVDAFMDEQTGTAMIVFNSVCGCAAGMARPAVALAMQHDRRPDRIVSVFAGQDVEAADKARSYFPDLPPSSPSFVLIKNGQTTHYVPRQMIEGRDAHAIAQELVAAFDQMTAG